MTDVQMSKLKLLNSVRSGEILAVAAISLLRVYVNIIIWYYSLRGINV